MLFINLKTYPNGTGAKAKQFVLDAEKIHKEINVPLTILVQTVDMYLIAPFTSLPIWAQHIDNIEEGKHTGWISGDAVIEAGVKGSLINHAEHKMAPGDIREIIQKFKSENFSIMVSCRTPEEAFELDSYRPTFLSYEPSVYIGTSTSVLDVAPHLISNLTGKLKTPLIVGSGIKSPDVLAKGLQLGAKGFLISSSIMLSDDPIARLKEYMLEYRSFFPQ